MIFAPFFEVWDVLPEYPARPAFDPLSYKTHRILWMAFYKQMNMIYIHSHIDDLNLHLFAGRMDNSLYREHLRPKSSHVLRCNHHVVS